MSTLLLEPNFKKLGTGVAFEVWEKQIRISLGFHGVLSVVTGTYPCPPTTLKVDNEEIDIAPTERVMIWRQHDEKASAILTASIADGIYNSIDVNEKATALSLYTYLRNKYRTQSSIRGHEALINAIHSAKSDSESLPTYLNKVNSGINDYKAFTGKTVELELLFGAFLKNLPTTYISSINNCLQEFEKDKTSMTWELFQADLLRTDENLRTSKRSATMAANASKESTTVPPASSFSS